MAAVGGSLLRAGPAAWRRGAGHRHRRRAAELVPQVIRMIGAPAAAWVAGPVAVSSTRTAVVPLGPPGDVPVAMAKLPGTLGGGNSQEREGRTLSVLAAEPAVGDFVRLLPLRLAAGRIGNQPFAVERAMPGVPGASTAGELRDAVAVGAVSAIAALHARTARPAVVDAALIARWVDHRVDRLAQATRRRDPVERLRGRLRAAWAGRRVEIGWVHGDFWLGNVIVDPATGTTAGIVDWEWAGADELPAHDLVYACLHARMRAGAAELGDVVADLLNHPTWTAAERALHRAAGAPTTDVDPDVLLLVWLRQIAANMAQMPAIARNPVWVRRNITSVLRGLDGVKDPTSS